MAVVLGSPGGVGGSFWEPLGTPEGFMRKAKTCHFGMTGFEWVNRAQKGSLSPPPPFPFPPLGALRCSIYRPNPHSRPTGGPRGPHETPDNPRRVLGGSREVP